MTAQSIQFPEVPTILRRTVREAGAIARRYFRPGARTAARIWSKAGGSPVTEADLAVDGFLKARLSQAVPEAAWLSEETVDDPVRLERQLVWIVDPIDGTRAFLSGHPDWSIAVALLAAGRPVMGVVYAPAPDLLYEASLHEGARRNGAMLKASAAQHLEGARVAGPKPLVDRLERRIGTVERVAKIPSLAIRLARVAEGSLDVGLVSSDSRDWDLAAADLILHEAGGRLTDLSGTGLVYNKSEPVHTELVASPGQLHLSVIEAMTA